MNLTEQIRGNFPKTIDKSKPVFKALIANDNSDAAIQKQLVYLFNYMKEWISTPNVYEQRGTMLEKTIKFFSFLERFTDETEKSLKNRFGAIFIRNHDTKWGTPYDVKSVFRQYFKNATIYLVENVNKIDASEPELANLFLDGDFSTSSPTDWDLTKCTVSAEARFSKSFGVLFDQSGGTLSQTVNVPLRTVKEGGVVTDILDTTFYVHLFLKGKVSVQIKNSADKYWDFTSKTWKNTETDNFLDTAVKDREGNITSYEWNNKSIYFTIKNPVDVTEEVTITFKYADVESYADYFRLYQKQPYSSFTVIAHFEGNTASKAFGLAAGNADPNIETQESTPPQPRYSNYGYYDKSFLSGVPIGFASDIYEDLLDYLRAQGVKAYLEIVIRDYSDNE